MGDKEILCYLIEKVGTIEGRKKIQKCVYLLKSAGLPVSFRFKWGAYGPFSPDLADQLDHLIRAGVIGEEMKNGVYLYRKNEKTKIFSEPGLSYLENRLEKKKLKSIEDLLFKLQEKESRELELLASIDFLRYPDRDDESVIKKLKELKKGMYTKTEMKKGFITLGAFG